MQTGPLDFPAGLLLFAATNPTQLFLPPSVRKSRVLKLAQFLFRHKLKDQASALQHKVLLF
jgi:hypothetical protein